MGWFHNSQCEKGWWMVIWWDFNQKLQVMRVVNSSSEHSEIRSRPHCGNGALWWILVKSSTTFQIKSRWSWNVVLIWTNILVIAEHFLLCCCKNAILEVVLVVFSVVIVMCDHFQHLFQLHLFIVNLRHPNIFLCSLLLRCTRCSWISRSSRLSRSSRISRTARTRWATRPSRCSRWTRPCRPSGSDRTFSTDRLCLH